jgi:tRNA 2-thiouridine synthesizing protein B
MSTLHTVNKSPFTNNTLTSCLQVCGEGDAILLLEDGVLAGLKGSPCTEELTQSITRGINVFALAEDVQARGLTEKIRADIRITDYNGFVQLSLEHKSVQSWY